MMEVNARCRFFVSSERITHERDGSVLGKMVRFIRNNVSGTCHGSYRIKNGKDRIRRVSE